LGILFPQFLLSLEGIRKKKDGVAEVSSSEVGIAIFLSPAIGTIYAKYLVTI
jgi:hypothetical protein